MKDKLVCTLLALGFTAATSVARECTRDSTTVRRARAVATGIIDADNQRDLERVLGYYAADALLMPPNEDVVVGREAIRPRYEDLFASFDPEIEAHIEEACVAEDLAFVRGRNRGRFVSRRTAEIRELNDAFLMLLRREPGGAWRISHLMWNPASP